MRIKFSLSGFIRGVEHPFIGDHDSPCVEFIESLIGLPVYLDRWIKVGKIVEVDKEKDLAYAEIPDDIYESLILEARGFNCCSFEIVRE